MFRKRLVTLLLFVTVLFSTLLALPAARTSAELTAGVSQSTIDRRQFYYQVMDIKSGDSTVKKLTIYTIRCNPPEDGEQECDPNKEPFERWVVQATATQLVNDAVLRFTAVDPDTGTRTEGSFGAEPDIVVSRDKLGEGSVSQFGSNKLLTFAIRDTSVAQAIIKQDPSAGGNQDSDGVDAPTTGTDDEEEEQKPKSCESEGGEMSWLLCPILRQMDNLVEILDRNINGLLTVPDGYFDNPGFKSTWGRIRNISYTILVPILLIMVISTALGFDLISAYTVKKALPRLVAAIIFIALSFEITTFLVELANNVGSGVSGLLTSSFGGKGSITLASLFDSTGGQDAGLFVGILIGGAGLVAITSIGIILSYALVTVVALLIGFIALSFRQMLVVALILLAPLAILAWIFPGNDKLWKLWWGTFSKLLLLYPLIMVMVGAGRVFAQLVQITTESGDGPEFANTDIVSTLLKLAAYVGPYFFIPAAFKFAGGLFATLAGMANDRGRGLFDTQRKKRAETRAGLRERSGAGHRFNPNRTGFFGAVGRKFNTTSSAFVDPKNTFDIGFKTARGKTVLAGLNAKTAGQSTELAKWMSDQSFNQEALSAIIASTDEHGHLDMRKVTAAAARLDEGTPQDRAAASQLRNSGQFLANLSQSEEFGRANIAMAAGYSKGMQGFLDNTGDDQEIASLANTLNGISGGLGDTFITQASLMNMKAGGGSKVGYSVQRGKDGQYIAGGAAARATQIVREGVAGVSSMKASAVQKQLIESGGIETALLSTPVLGPDGKPQATIVDDATGQDFRPTQDGIDAAWESMYRVAYGYTSAAPETAAVVRRELERLGGPGTPGEARYRKAKESVGRASGDPAALGLGGGPPPGAGGEEEG